MCAYNLNWLDRSRDVTKVLFISHKFILNQVKWKEREKNTKIIIIISEAMLHDHEAQYSDHMQIDIEFDIISLALVFHISC